MIKHIMFMAIFQTTILFTIIFAGFKFFPEGVEGRFNGCDKDGNFIMKDGKHTGSTKLGLTCV